MKRWSARGADAHRLASASFALVFAAALCAQGRERSESFPSGAPRAKYSVDAEGRRVGPYLEMHEDGSVAVRANYRAGLLDGGYQSFHRGGARHVTASYLRGRLSGNYEESSADGGRVWTAAFLDGKPHGDAKLVAGTKTVMSQKWREGTIVRINDFVPHPRPAEEIGAQILKILALPVPTGAAARDPKAPDRYAALRRLQAYRYLCGVPWEELALDPSFNDLCDAASEVCEKIGRLDHTPPDPGGLPPGRYEQGFRGASHSNLSVGADLPGSVDGYMDDSDESNVDRLGHRRWCLNPEMRKTGFGNSGRYAAMWSQDRSGPTPKGLKTVAFPPPGFIPSDFFGNHYAWSVSFVTGPWPARQSPKATVEELDQRYLPIAPPLTVKRTWVLPTGRGTPNCIGFVPAGIQAVPGRRYLATISLDDGATTAFQYVVEFPDPGAPNVR